jgi:hypothetical protein
MLGLLLRTQNWKFCVAQTHQPLVAHACKWQQASDAAHTSSSSSSSSSSKPRCLLVHRLARKLFGGQLQR